MDFSEAEAPWQPIPPWAEYLVRAGFTWGDAQRRRRIGVISLPCDSAGAALVMLGALRHRLTVVGASDALSHFERVQKLAARRESEFWMRHRSMKGRFRLEGEDARGGVWARQQQKSAPRGSTQNGPPRVSIHAASASEWRFEQEAPVETVHGSGIPYGPFYGELLESASPVLPPNLSRSDSAICLAGRVTGEAASRNAFSGIRFRCEGQVADLSSLLTIHGWLVNTVSRVTFFNSRTRELDRNSGFTALVVADGDAAFLRAVDAAEFKDSDVLGVIPRAIERDRLEAVGTMLADRSQWYLPDRDTLGCLRAPVGITTLVLQRRPA